MRARFALLLTFLAVGTLGLGRAGPPWGVRLTGCEFVPPFRAIDVGDSVTWDYDEGSCAPANHAVRTYGSPPRDIDSSPGCTSAFSTEPACMNEGPIKRETFTFTFARAGVYNYYCPFHATLSASGCSGMCGQIKVNAPPTNPPPTTPPTTPPPTTTPPATSPPATSSPTGTPTTSPLPTGTATVSPSPTSTELAKDADGGGGPGRGFVALASLAVLGSAAFLVWRTFIGRR